MDVKLIVVMGHESCGVITAALEDHDSEEEKKFRFIFRYIAPAMRAVKKKTVNNIVKKTLSLLVYQSIKTQKSFKKL